MSNSHKKNMFNKNLAHDLFIVRRTYELYYFERAIQQKGNCYLQSFCANEMRDVFIIFVRLLNGRQFGCGQLYVVLVQCTCSYSSIVNRAKSAN